jgi:hypothetical protein
LSVATANGTVTTVDKKDHFDSTLYELLNSGEFSPFIELTGAGTSFARGGLDIEYVADDDDEFPTGLFDLDVSREYYVSRVDPTALGSWTLEENPHVLLEALALPTHVPDGPYVTEEALREFIARWGQLTWGFLREEKDPEGEMFWNLEDPRNANFVFNFSFAVGRLRYAARLADGNANALPELLLLLDESPAPSLYRALLLQILQRVLRGEAAPRPCAGCGRWFFETSDASTAVHRTGWKRRDAKYHSKACLKAASERRRRARIAAARRAA